MNFNFEFALGFLALVLLLLCNPKVGYATPLSNPCTLLTQAQVSKTLDTAVVAGEQEGQFDCEWDQVGWTMAKGVRVLLRVLEPVGHLTPAQRFNTIKSKPAIGDSAYTDAHGAIHVLKGKVPYYIAIDPLDEKETKDLAASIAGRI